MWSLFIYIGKKFFRRESLIVVTFVNQWVGGGKWFVEVLVPFLVLNKIFLLTIGTIEDFFFLINTLLKLMTNLK